MTAPIRPTPSTGDRSALPLAAPLRPARDPGHRVTTRFADPAERERVLAWLDAGLRPGRPGRLVREYPLLFAPDSRAVPITVWSGARPVSFCLLWPTSFRLRDARLRTGLISLVYTDPDERGRGLARKALDAAQREARARDLGLCLLWSELADFYAAQGFTRAGSESLLGLDADVIARLRRASPPGVAEPLRVERATTADWKAIAELRALRRCHVDLAEAGAALAGIPDLDVRVVRGGRGLVAFAMCGRGDDFGGVVHEWGGDPEGVLRCCAALVAEAGPGNGLLLLAPDERSEVAWRLREAGAPRVRNPLAWFALTSLPVLAADLAGLAPGFARSLRLEPAAGSEAAEGSLVLVDRRSGEARSLEAAELMALLFSKPSDPAAAAIRARIADLVPTPVLDELPLPLFVWGLESI
ncbi:MAG: GNAT family N-acetyltransferase [Myxococcota bacterium]